MGALDASFKIERVIPEMELECTIFRQKCTNIFSDIFSDISNILLIYGPRIGVRAIALNDAMVISIFHQLPSL